MVKKDCSQWSPSYIFRSVERDGELPKKILQLWRLGGNEYEQDMFSKGIQLYIQIYPNLLNALHENNFCAGHADHCTVPYCI